MNDKGETLLTPEGNQFAVIKREAGNDVTYWVEFFGAIGKTVRLHCSAEDEALMLADFMSHVITDVKLV